jgi:hypothetical protein
MEKVTGIGGPFFRAQDPTALGRNSEERVDIAPSTSALACTQQLTLAH